MNRQSALPKSLNTLGVGDAGMPGYHVGRVTWVHADGTYDVVLEDLTPLEHVGTLKKASGPDRADDEPIPKRSKVGLLYAYGSKTAPVIIGVIERPGRALPPPPEGAWRRVFPNGMHLMVTDSGDFEMRMADGSFVTFGALSAPAEDHTGQKRESPDPNPFDDPPNVTQDKPGQYRFTIQQPDGTKLVMAGGAVTVHSPGALTVEAGGALAVKGASVTVEGDTVVNVKAPLLRLNDGTRPIARVGDATQFGGPIMPPGNLSVLA